MKTLVITGITSGIGKALFYDLAKQNHRLIGLGRNEAKLSEIKRDLKAYNIETVLGDLADFKALKGAVQKIKTLCPQGIDVLINNAAIVPSKKMMTTDGFEMQYQVNHLSVVYLTEALLPLLTKKAGRIITTASNAHKRAKFNHSDIDATKRYHPLRSYMRTKLYNIMYTNYLNQNLLKDKPVHAYAVHPGLVKTEIGTKSASKLHAFVWRLFTKRGITPEAALSSYKRLIDEKTSPKALYYYKAQPENYKSSIDDVANLEALYEKTRLDLNPFRD